MRVGESVREDALHRRRRRGHRRRLLVAAVAVLVASVFGPVSASAAVPADVTSALTLSPTVVTIGAGTGLAATGLPDATEADAWAPGSPGTYTGGVTIALCGNADSAGTPFTAGAFDPAQHCDGGDARSASQRVHATATNGGLLAPLTPRVGLGSLTWDDDADPSTPDATAAAGIGSALATCVPALVPCGYLVTDDAAATFTGRVDFFFAPPPTVGITSITGQAPGALAARAGNTLNVAGTNWQPGSALLVRFCNAFATDDCDASSSSVGLSIDPSGVLTGSIPVHPLNTVGARVVKITQLVDSQSAVAALDVLGPRSITIGPESGGPGTAVTVNGSGFDPLQAVTLTGHDGANPTSDVGAATVDAHGGLTGSIVVNAPGTVSILVREDDAPTTEGASSAFSFNSTTQAIELSIDSGALSLAQASPVVDMDPIELTGTLQTATGALQPVTIIDNRGTLAGWSVHRDDDALRRRGRDGAGGPGREPLHSCAEPHAGHRRAWLSPALAAPRQMLSPVPVATLDPTRRQRRRASPRPEGRRPLGRGRYARVGDSTSIAAG